VRLKNYFKVGTNKAFTVVKNPKFLIILFMDILIAWLYYSYPSSSLPPYDRSPFLWYLVSFEFAHNLNGFLIYIPLLYAAYALRLNGLIITWFLSICLLLPYIIFFSSDLTALFANILALSVPIIVFSFLLFEKKWRERDKAHMAQREAERQFYLSKVMQSQELERQRIARELHDETTQRLLIVASKTQNILDKKSCNNQAIADEELEIIRDEILDISKTTRTLSLDLRPSILDNLGLVPALRWIVDKFGEETSIDANFVTQGNAYKLNSEIEINLFRIVQEALNNVRRHSRATKASVSIEFFQDYIKLDITDNGTGFNTSEIKNKLASNGKMGIIGIQERVKSMQGKLDILSYIGRGTKISLFITNNDHFELKNAK